MMAQAFPPGMAPGHPGIGGHGHPMGGMQHAGGPHMGVPGGPGMMQGMHPGVSGPQVTQGPMVTGMAPGPGTPAPGGPMQNPMAMAHLGSQQHMFQQQGNPQMFGTMPMNQQHQALVRQQMMQKYQQQQQQQQQQGGMPMGIPNSMPQFNAAQMAQMKMNMPMQQQMQMQAHQNAQHNMAAQHHQHQQQLLRAQAQQAALAAQNQQRAQATQAQQMQMSRSQEQPTSQPPQPHPTPAPQNQPQPQSQSQPIPQTQPPTSQPTKAPAPPQPTNNQQQNQPTPQIKQGENEDEPQIKQQDGTNAMMMQDIPKDQLFQSQKENAILRLILFQDSLANPGRPQDLDYWEGIVNKFFSPFGVLKHQFVVPETGLDKSFGLQYPSIARYLHSHFLNGVKQMLLSSYEHLHANRSTGETSVTSPNASLTYVFNSDVRVSTQGSLMVLFDEMNRILRLDISAAGWTEYLPRSVLTPVSPDQTKDGKNKAKKNQPQPNANQAPHMVPVRTVSQYGVPQKILGWLEVAEIMTQMMPLIDYSHQHTGVAPREAMMRLNSENAANFANANQARLQNQMVRQANGQIAFPPGMNGPNQFASPAMAHLGLPQGQGSPHLSGPVHTPSPAQNAVGGVAMMHQMSAQGSNLSGSQGPSTNTSPNVSNKRRRASQIKLEEENANQSENANKVKPSPRIPKRQKGS